MMEEDNQPIIGQTERPKVKFYHYIGDFFNTFKAFIGTNYLALPYAFKQSGLVFGVVGVFIIATLTDHCVQLMLKCKYIIIDRIVEEETNKSHLSNQDQRQLRRQLENTISYGDMGKYALGNWCSRTILCCVAFTQYFTCVAYVIFVGNTLFEVFPLVLVPFALENGTNITHGGFVAPVALNSPPCMSNISMGVSLLRVHNVQAAFCKNPPPSAHIESVAQHKLQSIEESGVPFRNDAVNLPNEKWNGLGEKVDFSSSHVPRGMKEAGIVHSGEDRAAHTGVGSNDLSVHMDSVDFESPAFGNSSQVNISTTTTSVSSSTANGTTTTVQPNETTTATPITPDVRYVHRSIAPDLRYLCLIPFPLWLLTTLVRKLRTLAPCTVIASIFLFAGAISVMAFLISDFTVAADGYKMYKFLTLPIFIGQLIGAYEGIGCVIPIESSMEGNRGVFPKYIHASIYSVFFILTAFGTMGYLRYGEHVEQIIVLSIPQHSILSTVVDITLVLSVLFTYPLQCFPCIEILEGILFGQGKCCGGKTPEQINEEVRTDIPQGSLPSNIQDSSQQGLLRADSSLEESVSEVAIVIPKTIPAWKRNLARCLMTISVMLFGILLRNVYAFLNAFIGAVGSSLLAFIIPCLIHLKLRFSTMPTWISVKDILIIILATIASILVVVMIIIEIIHHDIKF